MVIRRKKKIEIYNDNYSRQEKIFNIENNIAEFNSIMKNYQILINKKKDLINKIDEYIEVLKTVQLPYECKVQFINYLKELRTKNVNEIKRYNLLENNVKNALSIYKGY